MNKPLNELAEERPRTDGPSSRGWLWAERSLLYVIALALPWEIYQRTPIMGLTLTKISGGLLIAMAVSRALWTRSVFFPRTGLEAPIGLFAAVCAISVAHSIDQASSLSQLWIYATYLVFFFAIVPGISETAFARRLFVSFSLSGALVGVLAILCALGWAAPTLVETKDPFLDGGSAGVASRMVAASDDFNGGAFPALTAFAFVLFSRRAPGLSRRQRGASLGVLVLLLAGMLVAVSRSALAIAIVLTAIFAIAERRDKRFSVAAAGALFATCALGAVLAYPHLATLFARLSNLDSSELKRVYGYLAALSILPEFWLWGTGLDASGAPLAASAFGEKLGGATLHNMPFKILLELGVFGLLSFLWLWYRIAVLARAFLVKNELVHDRAFGIGFLAVAFALFWFLMFQPLAALSLYPFVLAVGFGPVARLRRPKARTIRTAETPKENVSGQRAAVAVVALIVLGNALGYNRLVSRIEVFKDTLHRAAIAEKRGEGYAAISAYRRALDLSDFQPYPFLSRENGLSEFRYFSNAAQVTGLRSAYESLGMAVDPESVRPSAAAAYGLGRLYRQREDYENAAAQFDYALSRMPRYAEARSRLADCHWELGHYERALRNWSQAREDAGRPENLAYRREASRLLERARRLSIQEPKTVEALLEAAGLLRRTGNWDEAVPVYKQVLRLDESDAEAKFCLNLNRRISP